MEKNELEKLNDCYYRERAVKGDGVKTLAEKYYSQDSDNKGLIIGYGAEYNKEFGYLKGFSEDQIYMSVEFEYEGAQ